MKATENLEATFEAVGEAKVRILERRDRFQEYTLEDCQECLEYSQGDVPGGVPLEFAQLIPVFCNIQLVWLFEEEAGQEIYGGEFFFNDFYAFLTEIPKHLITDLPTKLKSSMKFLRVFDDQYKGGNGRLTLIDVRKENVDSPYWFYRQGEVFKMNLSIPAYFEKLSLTMGIYDWQWLFVDLPHLKNAKWSHLVEDILPALIRCRKLLVSLFGVSESDPIFAKIGEIERTF